jgi:hypothetical protein
MSMSVYCPFVRRAIIIMTCVVEKAEKDVNLIRLDSFSLPGFPFSVPLSLSPLTPFRPPCMSMSTTKRDKHRNKRKKSTTGVNEADNTSLVQT